MEFQISAAAAGNDRLGARPRTDRIQAERLRWMDGTFPWENMKKLADLGVLGMSVPEEYGGLGLPILDTALILEEIAKVDYVTAMAVMGEAGVQTRVIARYAPHRSVSVFCRRWSAATASWPCA